MLATKRLIKSALICLCISLSLSACADENEAPYPNNGIIPDDGHADLGVDMSEDRDLGGNNGVEDMGSDVGPDPKMYKEYLYLGETDGEISIYVIDEADGSLTLLDKLTRSGPLGFLAFSPDNTRLYAAVGRSIDSYDLADPIPLYLGSGEGAGNATHLTVSIDNQRIFTASYGDALVEVYPVDAQGVAQDASDSLGGQSDPGFCQNAHQVRAHPDGDIVYVPCLGSDHIASVTDSHDGTISKNAPAPTDAGAGPRHMDFHPTLDIAYVIGEVGGVMEVFDTSNPAAISRIQGLSTLPDGVTDRARASDVHVSPDGRFVYGINRQPQNNIAIFSVDQTSGELSAKGHVSTGGDHARTFTISRSGKWLYVGNSNSQTLTSFSRDVATGALNQIDELTGFSSRVFFVGVRSVEENP